jgi:hypothetical protein
MPGAIEFAAVELGHFFAPLRIGLVSAAEFSVLLRRLGIVIPADELQAALDALPDARENAIQLVETIDQRLEDGLQAADAPALFDAARPLFADISTIAQAFTGLQPLVGSTEQFEAFLQDLPEELFELLVHDYLVARFPIVLHILSLLDVVHVEEIPASGHPKSRGARYTRIDYDWSRISLAFENPGEWARVSYGWGVDFDSDQFILRLVQLFDFIGGRARIFEMTDGQADVLAPLRQSNEPFASMAMLPLARVTSSRPDGSIDLDGTGEIGIAVFPAEGDAAATRETDKGLAISPYADGRATASFDLSEGVTARLTGSLGGVGGAIFSFRPSGADVDVGVERTALSGSFALEIEKLPAPGDDKLILLGRKDSTRVQADRAVVSVGGDVSNSGFDFFTAGGIRNLTAVIDFGEDGFLGALVSDPAEISAGDVILGWRAGRGLYFEGGTSISVTVPLDLDLGPVSIAEVGVVLDLTDGASLTLAITGDATLGPLFAFIENAGVVARLVPAPSGDGLLGRYDVEFSFSPPTGYALALDAPPIEGGGSVRRLDHDYRGALALKFETFGFSAFAILTTQLPNGREGFSFAASIFGSFSIPLGFGFVLTGVGGVIGINRTIDADAMRSVLFEGRLDNILFPADPIANAQTILQDMAAILPAREGQHLFGPVARISWGQPSLVDVKLGVVLEVGRQVRVLVLGVVTSRLPTREAALVSLNVSFFGEIDFAARTISFDAALVGSRVLTWAISGDAAIRSGWGARIDHIASFGGLHPEYPRPANLPELRRLSINFGTNNPKVTLTAYCAVTQNSLQFGARGDLYARGPKVWLVGRLAAEGWIAFDALVYFDPFAFDARLGGALNLLVDGDVILGLGFDLRLQGPNPFRVSGRVWATVFKIDVSFRISHSWGDEQSLPIPTVDAVRLLRETLERSRGFEVVAPMGRSSGVAFAAGDDVAGAVDPIGGLRLVQRALPLGVTIEKVGEARVSSAANRLELRVFSGTRLVQLEPARLDFVRGHFFALTESERLRAPAFEQHDAGVEFAPDQLAFSADAAIEDTYDYEVIEIGAEEDREAPLNVLPHVALRAEFGARWMDVTHERVGRSRESFKPIFAPAEAIHVERLAYVSGASVDDAAGVVPDPTSLAASAAFATAVPLHARLFEEPPSDAHPGEVPIQPRANEVVAAYVAAAQFRE